MSAVEIILIIIGLAIIGLLIYLISRLPKPKEEDTGTTAKLHGDIMGKLGELHKTVEERAKQQDKIDKQRDEMMKQREEIFTKGLSELTRLFSGTKERGMAGEHVLKEVLSQFIKSNKVVTNLHVDGGGVVEFAWKIIDNKFIPIDSKLPDVISAYKEMCQLEGKKEQQGCKKEILEKMEKHAKDAIKYKNKKNTTDRVIIAIPDAIFDVIPEINSIIGQTGVIVCGYHFVTYVASYIEREYLFIVGTGDVGEYKELLDKIMVFITEIKEKTGTIDRGLKIIGNANEEIKDKTAEAERNKPKKKKIIITATH